MPCLRVNHVCRREAEVRFWPDPEELRLGRHYPGKKTWGPAHMNWLAAAKIRKGCRDQQHQVNQRGECNDIIIENLDRGVS